LKKSYVTDAINLKTYPLNDNDSIVVMFSKNKGLISAVARGAKSPKSKLGARIQMFIANTLMLFEGRNLDTISQAQSLNTFSKIRYDMEKLSYSMYISELVNVFCSKQYNQDENYEEIYNLIFNSYDRIAKAQKDEEVLLTVLKFQLKLMNILGWGLDFTTCVICQHSFEGDIYYSSSYNGFLCYECSKQSHSNIKINLKIKEFLDEMLNIGIDEKSRYDELVNMVFLETCFNFMKKYIENISHKKTKIFEVMDCVR